MRYYFDLIEDDDYVEDTEGQDLPSIEVARSTAIRTARSLIAHGVLAGRLTLRGTIQVLDESRSAVLELPFLEALDAVDNVPVKDPT